MTDPDRLDELAVKEAIRRAADNEIAALKRRAQRPQRRRRTPTATHNPPRKDMP